MVNPRETRCAISSSRGLFNFCSRKAGDEKIIITKQIEVPDLKAARDGIVLEVMREQDPMDPREWDNLGTMVCWHSRYTLGDKQVTKQYELDTILVDILTESLELTDSQRSNVMEYADVNLIMNAIRKHTGTVMLPLYLMDHSGLSMSTGSERFRMADGAGWDWGQVGTIYATEKRVKKEYSVEKVTDEIREKVKAVLRAEVHAYDLYLKGESYYFVVRDEKTDAIIDSCGGFMTDSTQELKELLKDHTENQYHSLIEGLETCSY